MRNLSYSEYIRRREEGLCFHCGGPYSLRHKCLVKNMSVPTMGDDEEVVEEEEEEEEKERNQMELSVVLFFAFVFVFVFSRGW